MFCAYRGLTMTRHTHSEGLWTAPIATPVSALRLVATRENTRFIGHSSTDPVLAGSAASRP